MKVQFFDIVSIAAIFSYFVPALIVVLKQLWKDAFFVLFAIYWAIGGLVNFCDILPMVSEKACYQIGVLYNTLDIPFILAILYCTSSSRQIKMVVPFAAAAIVCMEVFGLATHGFHYESLKYSLGAGILIVLIVVATEIVRYMQTIEHSTRQNAKMFVYAAVLFEYATFIVIYIFDYFIKSEETVDGYLIYYFSTLGAIVIASCGYLLPRRYEKASTFSH